MECIIVVMCTCTVVKLLYDVLMEIAYMYLFTLIPWPDKVSKAHFLLGYPGHGAEAL